MNYDHLLLDPNERQPGGRSCTFEYGLAAHTISALAPRLINYSRFYQLKNLLLQFSVSGTTQTLS
jgi:hypothetical protein